MTKVTEHLEQRGVRFEVLPHRPVRSSLAEARALHLPPGDVVKVVVLEVPEGPALALVPADRSVDLAAAASALEVDSARLADEETIASRFPEFELGAVPPLGSLLHVPVVVDPAVLEHATITFPAGSARESVRTGPEVLFGGATVRITPITATPPLPG
jgi:Ala-tRNA(Pro) deacylase